jgi:hypothetical protein
MRAGLKPLGEMIAAATLAALAAFAAPAQAQTTSVEQANAKLAQVAKDRDAVEQEYAVSEDICNGKFFVNNCLDKAKEKRRVALSSLRAIEVEAERFKRFESVRKRDADLAERARKDAEELAQRTAHGPRQHKDPEDKPAPARAAGPTVAEREAGYQAKVQRQQAKEAAEADMRAAKAASFERKQVESERRQAEVAKKKEQNAAKAAAKEASDKKRAEAEAAAAAAAAAKAAASK